MDINNIGAVLAPLLSFVGTILTVIISGNATRRGIETELDKHNAVQDERIRNLTAEVQKHNAFAERIPRLEARVDAIEREVSSK